MEPIIRNVNVRQWTLRYREGQTVLTALIEADTEENAVRVGQTWCDKERQRRYIAVSDPVVADMSILVEKAVEDDYALISGIERLARNRGVSVEEVLEGIKKKRPPQPEIAHVSDQQKEAWLKAK